MESIAGSFENYDEFLFCIWGHSQGNAFAEFFRNRIFNIPAAELNLWVWEFLSILIIKRKFIPLVRGKYLVAVVSSNFIVHGKLNCLFSAAGVGNQKSASKYFATNELPIVDNLRVDSNYLGYINFLRFDRFSQKTLALEYGFVLWVL